MNCTSIRWLGRCYLCSAPGMRTRAPSGSTMVQSRAVLVLASLYLAFSLTIALSWQIEPLEGFIPDGISRLIYPIYKSSLAPLRLLHFLALAILVSQLFPLDWHGLMKPWMMAIIRCGENSLAVYCVGVLLSFAGFAILSQLSPTIVMQVVVSIGEIAIMTAAASLMTLASKQDRRPQAVLRRLEDAG